MMMMILIDEIEMMPRMIFEAIPYDCARTWTQMTFLPSAFASAFAAVLTGQILDVTQNILCSRLVMSSILNTDENALCSDRTHVHR